MKHCLGGAYFVVLTPFKPFLDLLSPLPYVTIVRPSLYRLSCLTCPIRLIRSSFPMELPFSRLLAILDTTRDASAEVVREDRLYYNPM